ncbi:MULTISPECIES: hypothetical protein [Streptomyces]|uniref:hypothetical protein n=1 Tax=Streptomyces TaxID=1883 RepID=UPI0036890F5B
MEQQPFPLDLIQTQSAWSATYRTLAAVGPGAGTVTLRRRLLRLSTQLWRHPYRAVPGSGSAARIELREQARSEDAREAGAA